MRLRRRVECESVAFISLYLCWVLQLQTFCSFQPHASKTGKYKIAVSDLHVRCGGCSVVSSLLAKKLQK